jgi:hypothetical protein
MHWPAFSCWLRMLFNSLSKNDFVVCSWSYSFFFRVKKDWQNFETKSTKKKKKFVFNSSMVNKGYWLFSSFSPLTFTHTRPTELFSTDWKRESVPLYTHRKDRVHELVR